LSHKVLLPGYSLLERYIASLRQRVEERLCHLLVRHVTAEQQASLEKLLTVPEGEKDSLLVRLRQGPVRISVPALIDTLKRLKIVRGLNIKLSLPGRIPQNRITALARFAGTVKIKALNRLPETRRLATMAAFTCCL
jgi:hypothetical protein